MERGRRSKRKGKTISAGLKNKNVFRKGASGKISFGIIIKKSILS